MLLVIVFRTIATAKIHATIARLCLFLVLLAGRTICCLCSMLQTSRRSALRMFRRDIFTRYVAHGANLLFEAQSLLFQPLRAAFCSMGACASGLSCLQSPQLLGYGLAVNSQNHIFSSNSDNNKVLWSPSQVHLLSVGRQKFEPDPWVCRAVIRLMI